MESEKVKDIKKALECCSTLMDNNATSEEQDNSCNECPYRLNDRCSWNLDKDALTLINELLSENAKLKQHKRELEGGQQDLVKLVKRLNNDIAELETKNEVLCVELSRYTENCIEMKNGTLKQFAERLKEISCEAYLKEQLHRCIEETLKEFVDDK